MSISLIPSTYYQLNTTQNGTSATGTGNGNTAPTSLTQTLVSDLDFADNQNNSGNSQNAYSLNLSPTAQMMLGNSATGTTASSNFTLTGEQQTTISNILAKYKDAPFSQSTFDSIQNDLESAGLGADQLLAKDMINSFSSIGSLVNALNGNYSSPDSAATTLANEQTKASNYMQNIIRQWQSISTTANSSEVSNS